MCNSIIFSESVNSVFGLGHHPLCDDLISIVPTLCLMLTVGDLDSRVVMTQIMAAEEIRASEIKQYYL